MFAGNRLCFAFLVYDKVHHFVDRPLVCVDPSAFLVPFPHRFRHALNDPVARVLTAPLEAALHISEPRLKCKGEVEPFRRDSPTPGNLREGVLRTAFHTSDRVDTGVLVPQRGREPAQRKLRLGSRRQEQVVP